MKNLKIKLILIFGWTLCAILILFSSMKSQLILTENHKEFINKIFPQGWGFFTKEPQSFELAIYKINSGKLEKIQTLNQSFENRLGFSRSSRMIGYEMSEIASKIKTSDWINNTDGNIHSSLKNKTIVIKSDYKFIHFHKGTYLMKLYKPIPYAWSKQNQEKYNPFATAKIQIK